MLALGVTGDVGAGKSTLTRLWGEMGASVIDADKIVRDLWARPSVIEGAVSLWGEAVLDGAGKICPAAVAEVAFSGEREYRRLNGLLHPLVKIEMNRMASCLEGWVVAEIPLLFEAGVPHWIDATVYVTSGEEARAKRNASRGWLPGEIKRRESFLLPQGEKKKLADIIIENHGGLDALKARAEVLAAEFRRMSDLLFCSAGFDRREDAEYWAERLGRERLAADFFIAAGGGACEGAKNFRLTFITLGPLFSRLNLPGDGPVAAPVRKMPYRRRAALAEELLP